MREIVFGCPGAGKTATLLQIVEEELARGVAPERVAYVTFTRRAAEEAVARAVARFGLSGDQLPLFRTLHSLAFRALGLTADEVLGGPQMREFAEWAGAELTWRGPRREEGEGLPTWHRPGDRALHMEHLARARCVPLEEQYRADDDGLEWTEVDYLARALESFKRRHGLADFSDMISRFVEENRAPEVEVLIVDEAQDLSRLQWRMVERLAARARRVVVAGDDDQAIYRWAGADVEHLVRMEGAARVLDQSHRVPGAVQRLADAVIGPVGTRRPKRWRPRAEEGTVVSGNLEQEELWKGKWNEQQSVFSDNYSRGHNSGADDGIVDVQPVLALARNTYVLEERVAPALRRLGVLYEWPARPPVAPAALAAVHAWEQLRAGAAVSTDAARGVYRLMGAAGVARGCRDLAGVPDDCPLGLGDLEARHGLLTRAPWYEALDRLGDDAVDYLRAVRLRGERLNQRPRVRLSTIHGAKGGEARRVVLCAEMAARTYREMEQNEDDERRVWYVAATRAREELAVVPSERAEACPWL